MDGSFSKTVDHRAAPGSQASVRNNGRNELYPAAPLEHGKHRPTVARGDTEASISVSNIGLPPFGRRVWPGLGTQARRTSANINATGKVDQQLSTEPQRLAASNLARLFAFL